MTAIRATTIILAVAVVARVVPASATDDFNDVPFLFAKVSDALETEPTGSPIAWTNPGTGNSGTIVVTRTFFLGDGSPCRDYTRTTDRSGQEPLSETGTGCREADGRWMLKETAPPSSGPTPLVATPSESEVRVTPLPSPPLTPPAETAPSVVARSEPAATSPPPLPNPAKSTTQSTAKKIPKISSTTMPSRSD
ncbi:MAG: hypothetical protein GY791_08000 [Alphaproteobacteria bacterium]|nr:hypothetical protein [Alphaproteobacteria bacterium]